MSVLQASDESNATTGKRLEAVGVENSEDNRRAWRQLLYTAPGLGQYISGEAAESGWVMSAGGGGGKRGEARVSCKYVVEWDLPRLSLCVSL